MKVLVATKLGQGKRKNDFFWCNEGEPVGLAMECDGESVDGHCGCRRSFSGIDSRKGTTTARVVDIEITPAYFEEMYFVSENKAWPDIFPREETNKQAKELLRIAASFTVGAVVEKRGDKIKVRRI